MSNVNDAQNMDEKLLARMLRDFIKEASEILNQLNLNLFQLEKNPEKKSLIDEIFRAVHTLKGGAAFVGLKEVTQISRKMEEVFGAFRKGASDCTGAFFDVMYEGLDILTVLINSTEANKSPEADVSRILEKLNKIFCGTVTDVAKNI